MLIQKQITQLHDGQNQPTRPAVSVPDWFIFDGVDIQGQGDSQDWGPIFSVPRKNNKVEFYVTGQEYFDAVARAIENAKKSVFIAGWQVNFDVVLTRDGKTLFEALDKALAHADVFVMPWMSPKVGMDTGDLETMLAIHHLNVGRTNGKRALCVPAMAQGDMAAGLNTAFAHHQKLVVVDNEIAFVGGIDLAYGRRDDGAMALEAGGREGNELYNGCIAPTGKVSHADSSGYLTRAELLAACFEGAPASVAQFFASSYWRPLGWAVDLLGDGMDKAKDARQHLSNWWNASELVPQFVRKLQDLAADTAQEAARRGYDELNEALRGQLEALRLSGSAHASDAATLVLAWLNNNDLSAMPPELLDEAGRALRALVPTLLRVLSSGAAQRKKPYKNLYKKGRMLPGGAIPDAATQPRMPWHDVHCKIEGASVYDLSNNFVRRWDSLARLYGYGSGTLALGAGGALAAVNALLRACGISAGQIPPLRLERMPDEHRPRQVVINKEPKLGSAWVQVLRSAPGALLRDEGEASPARAQDNCLKAMLHAITAAMHFLYIEGQFFQSAHGRSSVEANPDDPNNDKPVITPPSGPMGALTDVRMSPGYRKYAQMLGIEGVPADEIARKLRWAKIDDVRRDIGGGGADFVNDVLRVINCLRDEEITRKLGPGQAALLNPVGRALVERIERAVIDRTPFHLYMVLPLHPEGRLDTVNIMAQVHLTMQSLVYGEDSLLNGVRRAIVTGDYFDGMKEKNSASLARARDKARELGFGKDLADAAGDRWKQYLTLLSLRNWTRLSGRPVTEQCYVHSKLLIADDRVAVLGSANINDRSLLGGRDSELAVVVNDDAKAAEALDGAHAVPVGQAVRDLRRRLWKKHFGLADGARRPASQLAAVLDSPLAPATWQAIQAVAEKNALAYSNAFKHLPQFELNKDKRTIASVASPIWPTWDNTQGKLQFHMPFNERFWRGDRVRDECFTWDARQRAPESEPDGVQGFIVALPIQWTAGENSRSRMNLTILANVPSAAEGTRTADATPDRQGAAKGETA
jgi:phospholipase D1/2